MGPSVKLWTESVRRNADAVRTDHNRLSEWLARIVAIPPTWGYSSISARALALPSWHADIERRTASAATRSAKGTRLAAGAASVRARNQAAPGTVAFAHFGEASYGSEAGFLHLLFTAVQHASCWRT